jgi:phospholipid/cholesterol/gamma-HCH transport system substrate-binding protein
VDQRIDPQTFLAVLTMRIDGSLRLPSDTSAEIASEGLLGGRFVALVPGGSDRILADGGQITLTQSAISLESLLGRFLFSSGTGQAAEGQQPQAPAR